MDEDWVTRLGRPAWPPQLTRFMTTPLAAGLGIAVLALAALGQAIGQTVAYSGVGLIITPAAAAMYGLPLAMLALLSTLPLVLNPVFAALVVAAANVLTEASFRVPIVAGMAALVIACFRLGAFGDVRGKFAVAQGLALGLGLPFLLIALVRHGNVAALVLAALVPVAAGAGVIMRSTRQERTYTEAGEALAGSLVAHTARGERARIARELHDVVAHHISMIAVLSETGRLATPGLPEAGARRFAEIGDTARAGLTEMRRLLGVLRDDAADAGPAVERTRPEASTLGDSPLGTPAPAASRQPQPGLAQLASLIDAAREASGAGTRLIISGPVGPLDPGVELAAYRIVQEALTNTRRHAPGAAVDVELRYGTGVLRLRVRDNGPGMSAAPSTEGHGLLGMRERALSVGGSLHTGTAPGGGFLIEAVLPAAQDQPGAEIIASQPAAGGRP